MNEVDLDVLRRAARRTLFGALLCAVTLALIWDWLGWLAPLLLAIPVFLLADIEIYLLAFGREDRLRQAIEGMKTGERLPVRPGLPKFVLFVIGVLCIVASIYVISKLLRGDHWALWFIVLFCWTMLAGCIYTWNQHSRFKS